MKQIRVIALRCLIIQSISEVVRGADLSIPKNLKIGISSAAYQVEGAWNVSGRSESIWDWWVHNNPTVIYDGSNADIACDSYHKYKEDVKLIKSIGLDFYRFSISWSRILPTGFANVINKEGLQYYKNLTAELKANGIEPYVTMYHFDHPQVLEDMGGWMNELMVDRFVEYASILLRELGDSVKMWSTINEPDILCRLGYLDNGGIAPNKPLFRGAKYICGHNILKAHAKVYHMYDEEFRKTQNGQIGLATLGSVFLPTDSNDTQSAEDAFQLTCGWFNHPILKGDYSEFTKTRLATISKSEGYEKSWLPEFSDEWISYIKGTVDYVGLIYYSSALITPDPKEKLGIHETDMGFIESHDPDLPRSSLPWIVPYPPGIRYMLRKFRDEYNNPPIRIMENGYPDLGGLDDYGRIDYLYNHMKQMLLAIEEDGVNVQSYGIWSLMDNFEANYGFSQKFGIFSVDFQDPLRPRTPKLSASWLASVLASRKLIRPPSITSD